MCLSKTALALVRRDADFDIDVHQQERKVPRDVDIVT